MERYYCGEEKSSVETTPWPTVPCTTGDYADRIQADVSWGLVDVVEAVGWTLAPLTVSHTQ